MKIECRVERAIRWNCPRRSRGPDLGDVGATLKILVTIRA